MACAKQRTRACFLSLAQSKLRLYSANHRPGYWRTAWAYSKQETENWLSNAENHDVIMLHPYYAKSNHKADNTNLSINVPYDIWMA